MLQETIISDRQVNDAINILNRYLNEGVRDGKISEPGRRFTKDMIRKEANSLTISLKKLQIIFVDEQTHNIKRCDDCIEINHALNTLDDYISYKSRSKSNSPAQRKSPESTSSDSAGHSGLQPSSEHNSPPLPPQRHEYPPAMTSQFRNAVIVKARTCKNPLVPLSADERKQLEQAMDYLNNLKIQRTDNTMIFFEFDTPTKVGCKMLEEVIDWAGDDPSVDTKSMEVINLADDSITSYFRKVRDAINIETTRVKPKFAIPV